MNIQVLRSFLLPAALFMLAPVQLFAVSPSAGPALARPSGLEVLLSKAKNSTPGFWLQNVYGNVVVQARKLSPHKQRKVLLYSGQFDPFHNSHRAELLGVLNSGDFDLAVVAPSLKMIGLPPDAQSPFWLRMLIAEKGVQDIPRAKVSSFILRRGIYGAPAAVRELRRQLGPGAEISLLMGSDNFKNIKFWDDVGELLSGANLLVNMRDGDELGRLPLAALPEGLGDYYRMEAPGFFRNPSTGRVIHFISVPTEEISSLQTLLAAMARDHEKLKSMFNPAALALVENYYYPFVPKALNSLRFQVATKSHESFKRIFGVEAGDLLARDWRVALALACQRQADPEAVAHTAALVYRAALQWPCGAACYPRLYAQAVHLGYDEEFAQVRRMAQTESGGELCSSHKYAAVPDGPVPLWKRLGRVGAKEPAYPAVFNPGEKVKIYLPLKPAEKDAVLAHGALSPCVKANGEKFCAEKNEEVPALLAEHLAGGGNDVFVCATLSPAKAKKRAGPDGEVLAAAVPAEALVFPGDPAFWPGARAGNPKALEHEVLAREIRPQWLEPVAPGK